MKQQNHKFFEKYTINLPKLPILWKLSLGFLTGISSVYLLKSFPNGEFILAIIALAWFLLKSKFYFTSAFLLGFVFVTIYTATLVAKAPDRSLIGKKITLIGKVDRLYQHNQVYFDFIITKSYFDAKAPLDFNGKIRVTWYKKSDQVPKTGETWQIEAKLKQLKSILNPQVKDFTTTKIANKIIATAFVGQNYSTKKLADAWSAKLWHKNWLEKLEASEIKGIKYINALVLGDASLFTNSDWRLFKKTGTLHLWIISGLHLGMLAGFLWLIFRLFTKKKFKLFFALVILIPILYANLSGWGIAAQRASFMLIAATLIGAGIRNLNLWTSFFIALLAVLISNPLAVLTPGFWLSFTAVASLVFALKARKIGKLRALLFSQLVVFISLLPFLYYFAELPSFLAPLFNLILIPFISFLLPLAMLGTILFLSLDISFLLDLSATGIFYSVYALESLSQLAPSLKPQTPMLLWLGFFALLPLGFYSRFIGFLALGLALIKTPVALKPKWQVEIFDVGQGLAVLVEKNKKYLLFDTGINYSADFAPVISPLIKKVTHKKLDYLVVSHKDKDHSGGQDLVMQEFDVWRTIGFKGENCTGAWQENWQGLKLSFIGADFATQNPKNAESCTLLIQDEAQNSLLLTGDILAKQEYEYLPTWQMLLDNKDLSLLIAAHHGSLSSSSKELVFGLKPKFVVYSTGFRNYFRHPSKAVVRRFNKIGALQLNTAHNGSIVFTFNSSSTKKTLESEQAPVAFSTQRQKRQYLWDYLHFK